MSADRFEPDILRKGSSVVMARYCGDVEFKASDLALFNYLLLRAYDSISPGAVHRVSVQDAMAYGRFDRSSQLHEAIRRLCHGKIEIDYIDGDRTRSIVAHFLSADVPKAENGILFYSFDNILVHFLQHPKVFSLLRASTSQALARKPLYSIRLYEAMALQFHKRVPVWRVTVPELREFLRIGDQYRRFDNFRSKVIERAIADINAVAEFDILVEYTRGGRGGAVTEVVFTAVSKSHSRLIEAMSTKGIRHSDTRRPPVDTDTIDIFDGRTFRERGGPAELLPETIDAARERIQDGDHIGQLIEEWREETRGRVWTDPDRAFLSWLDLRLERESDPLLKDIDGDVFGALLEGRV
jgi:Protein involved in initiation of plasmid replication